jgi:hypothetical protein
MKLLSTIGTGRKARVALALGAAAITGVAILGGAAAANAASTPEPKPAAHSTDGAPAVVAVDGAPDLTKVRQGDAPHSVPIKPRIDGGTTSDDSITLDEEPTLVEVPGAVPDLDSVEVGNATAVDAVLEPVGDGTTTARR